MQIAIMQPYFLPYIGYFQLINAVDCFVVYDDIKYTKRGWINRNRFLLDGRDELFSLSLSKDSDALDIRDRRLAPDFDRAKLLNRIAEAYRRAPCFDAVMPLLRQIVGHREDNLFAFLHTSLLHACGFLGIATPLVVSSTLRVDRGLRGQERVLAICHELGADTYVNAIGGQGLYARDTFAAHDIELRFLQSQPLTYPQFGAPFVPWLSILDVMMFNTQESISRNLLTRYDLA